MSFLKPKAGDLIPGFFYLPGLWALNLSGWGHPGNDKLLDNWKNVSVLRSVNLIYIFGAWPPRVHCAE
jgi:hypothetical protein